MTPAQSKNLHNLKNLHHLKKPPPSIRRNPNIQKNINNVKTYWPSLVLLQRLIVSPYDPDIIQSSYQVFFEWRGPSGSSSADEGRVTITEDGSVSTAEIHPLHLQVYHRHHGNWLNHDCIPCSRIRVYGRAQQRTSMEWVRPSAIFLHRWNLTFATESSHFS